MALIVLIIQCMYRHINQIYCFLFHFAYNNGKVLIEFEFGKNLKNCNPIKKPEGIQAFDFYFNQANLISSGAFILSANLIYLSDRLER
jgi:hypothetical protein